MGKKKIETQKPVLEMEECNGCALLEKECEKLRAQVDHDQKRIDELERQLENTENEIEDFKTHGSDIEEVVHRYFTLKGAGALHPIEAENLENRMRELCGL